MICSLENPILWIQFTDPFSSHPHALASSRARVQVMYLHWLVFVAPPRRNVPCRKAPLPRGSSYPAMWKKSQYWDIRQINTWRETWRRKERGSSYTEIRMEQTGEKEGGGDQAQLSLDYGIVSWSKSHVSFVSTHVRTYDTMCLII